MVLELYMNFQNHTFVTQFPYHGETNSEPQVNRPPHMVGNEVGIYDVFIGINNEPIMTLTSYLHILATFGHFNCVLLLLLHETVPLNKRRNIICV